MLLSTQTWYISHKNVGMVSYACAENPYSPKILKNNMHHSAKIEKAPNIMVPIKFFLLSHLGLCLLLEVITESAW